MKFHHALVVLALAACTPELPETESLCDEGACEQLSLRVGYATKIRDTAALSGMTNGVLLAGIGEVETNFSHCWAEAQWACKGPPSASCGGDPVIAGSSDGPCGAKQGGLGMFQFDAGTYQDTIRRHGGDIVTLEGNVNEVVPFLVSRAREFLPGTTSSQQALDWMNSIQVVDGDPQFEAWLEFIAWRYNGCKGCTAQEQKYRVATHRLLDEMGPAFWNAAAPIGADCSQNPASCSVGAAVGVGECVDWFDTSLHGFCSRGCEGICPGVSTFCADFKNNQGVCAVVPSADNSFCRAISGSEIKVVPRFVGNSGLDQAWRAVCAPPDNGTKCDGGVGECIDTNSMQCNGNPVGNLCPGGGSIQCCMP